MPDGLRLSSMREFSKDGSILFVSLSPEDDVKVRPKKSSVDLDIWNYKDLDVQPAQLHPTSSLTFTASLNIDNGRITRLVHENENMHFSSYFAPDTVAILSYSVEGMEWNRWGESKEYFINARRNVKKSLLTRSKDIPGEQLPPPSNYLQQGGLRFITVLLTRTILVWKPEQV